MQSSAPKADLEPTGEGLSRDWIALESVCLWATANAKIGIWQYSAAINQIKFDEVTAHLLESGDLPQPLTPAQFFERIHPEDRQDLVLRFELCAQAGIPLECSPRFRGQDQKDRWLELTAKREPAPSGGWVLIGTIRDVTEKTTIATALKTSESRLATVFSQAMVGVLHRDNQNNVLMVNDRYLELVGRSIDELAGVPFETFTHPDDLIGNTQTYREHSASGQPFTIEKRYVRPDGSVVFCEVNVSFLRDAAGDFSSTLVFAHDITARKAAQREERKAREMPAFALEGAGAGTWEVDLASDGQIQLSLNAMEIYGLPENHPGVLSREEWATLVDPSSLEHIEEEFAAFMTSLEPSAAEFKIRSADGQGKWVRLHGRAVFDGDRNPTKIVGLIFDDNERKRSDEKLRESEHTLRLTQEAAGIGTFVAEIGGRTIGSAQFFRNLGLPANSLSIDEPDRVNLLHPEDKKRVAHEVAQAIEADLEFFEAEYRIIRADNKEVRWILARVRPDRDDTGAVTRLLGAHLDITDFKTASVKLRDTESLNQGIVESSTDCIKILEVDGTLTFLSPTGLAALDVDNPASLLNTRWQDLWPPESLIFVNEAIALARSGHVGRFNAGCVSLKGNSKWLDVVVTPLRDEAGTVTQLLAITRDVTELHEQGERIRWVAEHDALTGLPNRNYFDARLKEVLEEAQAAGETVGLVALDVDNFKQVNDAFGHDAGDTLLKTLSRRVERLIEKGDFAARLGGDEFALVLRHLERGRDIMETARTIDVELRQPVAHLNYILDCKVSIGAAIFPAHGQVCDELLKSADIALYAAKKTAGKNILLFKQSQRLELDRRLAMIGLAKSALDRNEIVPFYQPKVRLRTGEIEGFEALLRWRDPAGAVHLPAEIEAAFEDFDLAHEISERMQDRVLNDIKTWRDLGLQIGHVAINAAAAEFSRNDFASRLLGKIHAANVPPGNLQIEVTETVFMGRGADHVGNALETLKASGVTIALDDFGTGYASLSHLKNFPVDTIKIDRSFITDLGTNVGDTAIVCALLGLASDLNLTVVAEGIETERQAAFLRKRGCDLGQGYLFGKAVAAIFVPQLVKASARTRLSPPRTQKPRRLGNQAR